MKWLPAESSLLTGDVVTDCFPTFRKHYAFSKLRKTPTDKAPLPRRYEFSPATLWKPQVSQKPRR